MNDTLNSDLPPELHRLDNNDVVMVVGPPVFTETESMYLPVLCKFGLGLVWHVNIKKEEEQWTR